LITTDFPICAKSADNGALIRFLLKEAGMLLYQDLMDAAGTIPLHPFDYTQLGEHAAREVLS
jgi:hypothetical protein